MELKSQLAAKTTNIPAANKSNQRLLKVDELVINKLSFVWRATVTVLQCGYRLFRQLELTGLFFLLVLFNSFFFVFLVFKNRFFAVLKLFKLEK